MISLRIAVGLLVGAALGACGEESPDALVNEDVSWQLSCASSGCNSFYGHDQTTSDRGFSVSCSKSSAGLTVKISDPGEEGGPRPPSELTITNLNAETGNCTVTVREGQNFTDNPGNYRGTCREGDCELTGGASGGWDFDGTITCDNLQQVSTASGPVYELVKASSGGQPVKLQLDNCN